MAFLPFEVPDILLAIGIGIAGIGILLAGSPTEGGERSIQAVVEDAPKFNGCRKFYIQPAAETKVSPEREYYNF